MRFYRDDPRTVTVRWFFVGEDTPFVPHPNSFVSSVWDSDDAAVPAIGEVPYSQGGWGQGLGPAGLPPPEDRRACGTAEQWSRGEAFPPVDPVALLPNGLPRCCGVRLRLPFGPVLWLTAEDIQGPQYASVGRWRDRSGNGNDATQGDAGQWPSKTFLEPEIPVSVEIEEDESLEFTRPLDAPSWALWAVVQASGPSGTILAGPSPTYLNALHWDVGSPSGTRSLTFDTGDVGTSPTVSASGEVFNRPLIINLTYDGSLLRLTTYGDMSGSSLKAPASAPGPLAFVGLPGSPLASPLRIGQLLWWDRSLSLAEDSAILRYLEELYPEGGEEMLTGAIMPFAGPLVPTGFLLCDGTDYEEADYPELAGAIAHNWDTFRGLSSPGVGRFRVPLLNGLAQIGAGGAVATGAVPTSARSFGDLVGAEKHTLVKAEMPTHHHTVTDAGHSHSPQMSSAAGSAGVSAIQGSDQGANLFDPNASSTDTTNISIDDEGGSQPHDNMQPSVALLFIIKT